MLSKKGFQVLWIYLRDPASEHLNFSGLIQEKISYDMGTNVFPFKRKGSSSWNCSDNRCQGHVEEGRQCVKTILKHIKNVKHTKILPEGTASKHMKVISRRLLTTITGITPIWSEEFGQSGISRSVLHWNTRMKSEQHSSVTETPIRPAPKTL